MHATCESHVPYTKDGNSGADRIPKSGRNQSAAISPPQSVRRDQSAAIPHPVFTVANDHSPKRIQERCGGMHATARELGLASISNWSSQSSISFGELRTEL